MLTVTVIGREACRGAGAWLKHVQEHKKPVPKDRPASQTLAEISHNIIVMAVSLI